MKRITLLLVSACLGGCLTSCKSPADTARLGSLANIGINYAARHGVLTDADVEALRAANEIILPPVRPEMTMSGK